MTEKNDLDFYVSQIQDDFMPYWNRFYDYEKGGILNCINNYGDKKLSDHKFTWSQGRYLWLLGRLYDLKKEGLFPRLDADDLMVQMQGTYRFLTEHSICGDSVCCYLLDRDGSKLKDGRTGRYDASLFADCFALIGMAQYTKALKLTENLPAVERLFQSIRDRAESGDYLTEPYPIPKGYRVHSIPMILVNTTYEYIKMRERLGLPCGEETAYGLGKVEEILDRDYCNGYIREHISTDENYQSLLLDRHVNPGHTLVVPRRHEPDFLALTPDELRCAFQLVGELRAGRFAGVGLDVYEAEAGLFFLDKSLEAVEDDTLARLVTFPNVLVTSHQAYYTEDAVGQIVDATARNVLDYREGRRSENVLVPRS
mgnify:CR=1 FL=1